MSKHQQTFKITIKSICLAGFSRIFVWDIFCELLSEASEFIFLKSSVSLPYSSEHL